MLSHTLKWLFFFTASKVNLGISCVLIQKKSLIYHKFKSWLIGNRTLCRPIQSVIILVIKQIGLPLRGRPILLITSMITGRIGLHSVPLPLPIGFCARFFPSWIYQCMYINHKMYSLTPTTNSFLMHEFLLLYRSNSSSSISWKVFFLNT